MTAMAGAPHVAAVLTSRRATSQRISGMLNESLEAYRLYNTSKY